MKKKIAIMVWFGLASHLFSQTPGTLESVFTIGVATPLSRWDEHTQGSIQVGLGGRYYYSAISLGAEAFLVQGRSKRRISSANDGRVTTIGLVPQVIANISSSVDWQLIGLVGYGVARVTATNYYRTDLIPTTNGPLVSTYGGLTTWDTTRPIVMAGLGWYYKYRAGKRTGLEVRWQQVATPGVRATMLSTCLVVAW